MLALFGTALKKEWAIMRSYGLNFFMQFVTLILVFVFLYFGLGYVGGGPKVSQTQEGLMVGYWLWVGIIMSLSNFSWNVMQYAQQGLLEQLYMTPWRLRGILAVEAAASFVIYFLSNLGLLLFFMLITGRWLRLEPVTTFLLYVATLLPGYGLGYLLAGLAMRYKNIAQLFNVLQFVMAGLLTLPVDRYPWLNVLPFAQGVRMLITHVRHGTLAWQFPWPAWAVLAAQTLVYFALGLTLYGRLENAARERGLLAHY